MIYCIDASRAGALSSLIAGNKLIFVLDPTTPLLLVLLLVLLVLPGLLLAGPISVTEPRRSTGPSSGTDTDTDTDTGTDTVPKYFARVFRCAEAGVCAEQTKQQRNKQTNKTERQANKLLK